MSKLMSKKNSLMKNKKIPLQRAMISRATMKFQRVTRPILLTFLQIKTYQMIPKLIKTMRLLMTPIQRINLKIKPFKMKQTTQIFKRVTNKTKHQEINKLMTQSLQASTMIRKNQIAQLKRPSSLTSPRINPGTQAVE